jgi:hypothetical protein
MKRKRNTGDDATQAQNIIFIHFFHLRTQAHFHLPRELLIFVVDADMCMWGSLSWQLNGQPTQVFLFGRHQG